MNTNGTTTARIPVIDICSDVSTEQAIAKELLDAVIYNGFVYIKNKGQDIPVDAIDRLFEYSKKFFESPVEDKEKYSIQQDNAGWTGMHAETLDARNQRIGDFKECFNLTQFRDGKAQQPLPPALVPHERELSAFSDYCHNLCLKILRLFAIGLQVEEKDGGEEWLTSRHDPKQPSGFTLRLLHYPSIPESVDYQPEVDIRAGAHSDYGSVTLLFQRPGQPGLEILTPTDAWAPVMVTPPGTEHDPSPPILLNIGDILSHWTNGLLKSTVHRVVFPKDSCRGCEDRFSVAYFCHPNHSTRLVPIPSERVKSYKSEDATACVRENGKVEVMTALEHLRKRLAASYLQLDWDKAKKQEV